MFESEILYQPKGIRWRVVGEAEIMRLLYTRSGYRAYFGTWLIFSFVESSSVDFRKKQTPPMVSEATRPPYGTLRSLLSLAECFGTYSSRSSFRRDCGVSGVNRRISYSQNSSQDSHFRCQIFRPVTLRLSHARTERPLQWRDKDPIFTCVKCREKPCATAASREVIRHFQRPAASSPTSPHQAHLANPLGFRWYSAGAR